MCFFFFHPVKVDVHNNMQEFHIQLEDILHAYISLIGELVKEGNIHKNSMTLKLHIVQ
jgi:hypothetical protein